MTDYEILDQKKAELASRRPLTAGEVARLMDEFTVEYTYNSAAIEGNTLTLRETDMVLQGLTVAQKPLKDHLEAVGHKQAFDFVCEMVRDRVPLDITLIKQIHTLVLADKRDDRGVFRRVPVRIMGASHTPPHPMLIADRMDQLLDQYTNREGHIVERVAWLHLAFERVHPFIDGNGRTGRLLVNLELMKAGFPPIDVKFTDRVAYYDAFEDYHQTQSTAAMATMFCRYLNERLDHYLAILASC